METSEKLKRIARFIPGIPGYRGGERSRETDKTVRLHITSELNHLRRGFSKKIRLPLAKHNPDILFRVDRTLSRMELFSNNVKSASRGYRNFFNNDKINPRVLDDLYAWDLKLFQRIKQLKKLSEKAGAEEFSETVFKKWVGDLEELVDGLEETFSKRHEVLSAGSGKPEPSFP